VADAVKRSGRKRGTKRQAWGLALLIVSILALLTHYWPGRFEFLLLPLFGVGFLAWAVIGGVSGFLIPGGILCGIGFGYWAQRWSGFGYGTNAGQAVFLGAVALGFLLITLLSLIFFRSRVLWPLWPAAFVATAGLIKLFGPAWQNQLWRILPYWPFALLGIALWLLVFRRSSANK
jgi:hypothetical protein